jgi:hypothetical protein
MTVLYTPPHAEVASGESVYFDGSGSSTGSAEIQQMSGDFNARLYLERSEDGGETYTTISQFDSGGMAGRWFTKDIQPIVSDGVRRLRVDNKDKTSGVIEVIGTEIQDGT